MESSPRVEVEGGDEIGRSGCGGESWKVIGDVVCFIAGW